jgi:Uncharacterized protein containing DHHC-type Zn finger
MKQSQTVEIYLSCSPTNTDETFPDDESLDHDDKEEEDLENNHEELCSNSLKSTVNTQNVTYLNDRATLAAARTYERFQHWKEHGYAVGLAPITWSDVSYDEEEEDTGKILDSIHSMLPRVFCRHFGRVGNMVIIKERKTWMSIPTTLVDERHSTQDIDAQSSSGIPEMMSNGTSCANTRTVNTQTSFSLVLGPYWPILIFFTLPLITLSSILVAFYALYKNPWFHSSLHWNTGMGTGTVYWIIVAVWVVSTMGLYLSLLYTSLVDPGILPRFTERPDNHWRWNDQGQSYIPPSAVYEPDCKVVIDEYHHTCIFAGTAIGKNNVGSFFYFVFFAIVRFVLDLGLVSSCILT